MADAQQQQRTDVNEGKSRRWWAQQTAWIHEAPASDEQRNDLLGLIRDQYTKALSPGIGMWCAGCRWTAPMLKFYRCYDCDLWLCPACARVHFGKRPLGMESLPKVVER